MFYYMAWNIPYVYCTVYFNKIMNSGVVEGRMGSAKSMSFGSDFCYDIPLQFLTCEPLIYTAAVNSVIMNSVTKLLSKPRLNHLKSSFDVNKT